MIVPPNAVYHQHFNTGTTPARYLAFKHAGSPRNSQGVLLCFISRRSAATSSTMPTKVRRSGRCSPMRWRIMG